MQRLCRKKNRSEAFTLIELAIVMTVIGAIVSAIWWAAGNASELQKENSAISELQTIAQNETSLMGGQTFSVPAGTNITSSVITSQMIPSAYVDRSVPTAADNPWSLGSLVAHTGLIIEANTNAGAPTPDNKTFRIVFYNTTYKGCLALLLQGTACQAGQVACPTQVYTAYGTSPWGPSPTPGLGWQSLGATNAATLCSLNATNSGSVEFDFSL